MTDKQQKIIQAALELFASEGYAATSTSKIARQAGVSEGLIFRHFESKQGLLDALIRHAEGRIQAIAEVVLTETDPNVLLRRYVQMPFEVPEEEYDYWRLQFKLKWSEAYYSPPLLDKITEKLAWAFRALGYSKPEMEAKLLSQMIDTVSVDILRRGRDQLLEYRTFLLEKYGVQQP